LLANAHWRPWRIHHLRAMLPQHFPPLLSF
jgi:hypothetical protein